MKEWVSMVSDTLLVIVDSHHQPRGQIFSSFYYVSLRIREIIIKKKKGWKTQGLSCLLLVVHVKAMLWGNYSQS